MTPTAPQPQPERFLAEQMTVHFARMARHLRLPSRHG